MIKSRKDKAESQSIYLKDKFLYDLNQYAFSGFFLRKSYIANATFECLLSFMIWFEYVWLLRYCFAKNLGHTSYIWMSVFLYELLQNAHSERQTDLSYIIMQVKHRSFVFWEKLHFHIKWSTFFDFIWPLACSLH